MNPVPGNLWFPGFFTAPVCILAAALAAGAVFLPEIPFFRITNPRQDVVFAAAWKTGEEFGIGYTHSVNKSRILDIFRARPDGSLILDTSRFYSFGAGVATVPEYSGKYAVTADAMEYSDMNQEIPDLRVFVGREADITLYYSGKEIRLDTLAPPGTSLRFQIITLSVADSVLYAFKKGAAHERS